MKISGITPSNHPLHIHPIWKKWKARREHWANWFQLHIGAGRMGCIDVGKGEGDSSPCNSCIFSQKTEGLWECNLGSSWQGSLQWTRDYLLQREKIDLI
jgi:hypothetical protein